MNTPPTTACCEKCVDGLNCMRVNCPCHSKTSTHTEEWVGRILDIGDTRKKLTGEEVGQIILVVRALLLKQRKEMIAEVRGIVEKIEKNPSVDGPDNAFYRGGWNDSLTDILAHLATLESSN